jgi:capsular exopolysaccharide synthesis family protein
MSHSSPGYPHANGAASNGAALPPPHRNGRAAAPPADDDGFSLADALDVLVARWRLAVGAFVVVFGLVVAYTLLVAPTYQANSLVYVDKQSSMMGLEELFTMSGSNTEVANEVQILTSRTIALRVADALMQTRFVPGRPDTLLTVLEVDDDRPEPLTRYDVAERLRSTYVAVSPVSIDTDLIDIVAESVYPEEAALIARLYADLYVEYGRETSRRRLGASRDLLDDLTTRFRQDLEAAEDTLTAFIRESEIVAPEAEVEQLLVRIGSLQEDKYAAMLELRAAETQLEALRREVDTLTDALPDEIASGTDAELQALRERIVTLTREVAATYAQNPDLRDDPTPEIARKQAAIDRLQDEVDRRARELVAQAVRTSGVGALDGERGGGNSGGGAPGMYAKLGQLSTMRARVTALDITRAVQRERLAMTETALADLYARLNAIPNKEIALRRFERTLNTQQEVYLALVKQLQQTRVAERSELGYVTIVDEAIAPMRPASPSLPLNLAVGLLLGGLVAVGSAFAWDYVDDKVHAPDELRKRGYQVLGVIPDLARTIQKDFEGRERLTVGDHAFQTSLVTLLSPMAPATESYRHLRTGLEFSRPGDEVQTVLVTSGAQGEGKSTTAMNLALAFAQAGRRTAYVDVDLRRPAGHRLVDVPREPGLVDVLFDPDAHGDLDAFAMDVDGLHVIPAGRSAPNPAEVVGSARMRAFVERLAERFDAVVLDAPPVLRVTDALLVAPHCDATLYVCAADATPWPALRQGLDALHGVRAHVAGLVLNRFTPRSGRSTYGAYGQYGERYGADRDAEETAAVA